MTLHRRIAVLALTGVASLAFTQADANDPRVYIYLADTYGWLGMDAEAEQAAERAKQLDPNAFEILR